MRRARRPLLIVGTGALPWMEEVRRVVADSGCPVLTTYHAKGLIDETTPEFGGLFTSSLLEKPLLRESDLVLAVGVDPVEPLPRPFEYRMPVIEINPWANPRRFFPRRSGTQRSGWTDPGISLPLHWLATGGPPAPDRKPG